MPETPADVVDAVRALLSASVLSEIGYFELLAARGHIGDDGRRGVVGPGRLEDVDVTDAHHELGVYWSDEGDRLLVRLLADLKNAVGEVRVGVQAEWVLEEMRHDDVPTAVEQEFVNRVAIMTLVPYLRSAVSDLSGRVFGTTLTLAIVRPGEIQFSWPAVTAES